MLLNRFLVMMFLKEVLQAGVGMGGLQVFFKTCLSPWPEKDDDLIKGLAAELVPWIHLGF